MRSLAGLQTSMIYAIAMLAFIIYLIIYIYVYDIIVPIEYDSLDWCSWYNVGKMFLEVIASQ